MQQKTKLLKQLFKLEWVSKRNSSTLIEHNTIKQQQQWQHNRTTTTTTKVTTTTRKIMQICCPWHRCSFSLNRNECKHEEQDGETHQIKFNSRLTLLLLLSLSTSIIATLEHWAAFWSQLWNSWLEIEMFWTRNLKTSDNELSPDLMILKIISHCVMSFEFNWPTFEPVILAVEEKICEFWQEAAFDVGSDTV